MRQLLVHLPAVIRASTERNAADASTESASRRGRPAIPLHPGICRTAPAGLCVEACQYRPMVSRRRRSTGAAGRTRKRRRTSILPNAAAARHQPGQWLGAWVLLLLFGSGRLPGCGEMPYLPRLFGDRLRAAQRHRLSSSAAPAHHPWARTTRTRLAWSNSLFEDNAEFGRACGWPRPATELGQSWGTAR